MDWGKLTILTADWGEICRVRLKPDGTRWCTGGEVKGKLANRVGSQYSHTTSEGGVSSITNADAHNSAARSRLKWRPPADLNGLVRFVERRNLVSARVPSPFKRSIPTALRLAWLNESARCCNASSDNAIVSHCSMHQEVLCYKLFGWAFESRQGQDTFRFSQSPDRLWGSPIRLCIGFFPVSKVGRAWSWPLTTTECRV